MPDFYASAPGCASSHKVVVIRKVLKNTTLGLISVGITAGCRACFELTCLILSAVLALGAVAEHAAAPSSFMLVSGATSAQETYLKSESVVAMFEPCVDAASQLDAAKKRVWPQTAL